jgi:hypothetical protein
MAFPYVTGKRAEVPEIPCQESVTLPGASTTLSIVDPSVTTVPSISALLMKVRQEGLRVACARDSAVPADPEFEQALFLRQVSSLCGGHVCKIWRDIRIKSGKGR